MVVFEKTSTEIGQAGFANALQFKKALLREIVHPSKYSKDDLGAHLLISRWQQPFPVVVMVFDKTNRDRFLMIESEINNQLLIEGVLARLGQESSWDCHMR